MEHATSPQCFVIGCDRLSSLTHRATGPFWSVEAHYCSDCYITLKDGKLLPIDFARLELKPVQTEVSNEGLSPEVGR